MDKYIYKCKKCKRIINNNNESIVSIVDKICGKQYPDVFCPHCGYRVSASLNYHKIKKRWSLYK